MEWQAIETAPKDGTRILVGVLYHVDGDPFFHEWVDCWWDERWLNFLREIPAPCLPTHWMPLPEPPE